MTTNNIAAEITQAPLIDRKILSPQELHFLDIFQMGIASYIEQHFGTQVQPVIAKHEQRLAELTEMIERSVPIRVLFEEKETEVGIRHRQFEPLLTALSTHLPCLLVGPAGSGKTHAAYQVSQALDLPFYSISVGAQTSKADLLGFINANGLYMTTAFRRAYEYGGVFLMDEIDAGNPNVLIIVNQALAAGVAPFPDGMVAKHENFLFVGTANTFGLGADRMYVGRNQLDAATLDRFITIEWEIDEDLERLMVSPYQFGERFQEVVKAVRLHVVDIGVRAVISPRMTLRGAMLLERHVPFMDVLRMSMPRADSQSYETMMRTAEQAWERAI